MGPPFLPKVHNKHRLQPGLQDVMPYAELYRPCPCYICKNEVKHIVTFNRHAPNALFENIEYIDNEDEPYADDINLVPLRSPTSGKRCITEATRALLDAYDVYFAKEDHFKDKLWVSIHMHTNTYSQTHPNVAYIYTPHSLGRRGGPHPGCAHNDALGLDVDLPRARCSGIPHVGNNPKLGENARS
jgi:hypothetical protein